MQRLITLKPNVTPDQFRGQRAAVVKKLRELGATRKPVAFEMLVAKSKATVKHDKRIPHEACVGFHVRGLAAEKKVKVARVPNGKAA